MADAGLSFELDFSTKKAKKEVDSFVAQAKKGMMDVQSAATKASKGGKGGGVAGAITGGKELARADEEIRKSIRRAQSVLSQYGSHVEKEAKRVQGKMRDMFMLPGRTAQDIRSVTQRQITDLRALGKARDANAKKSVKGTDKALNAEADRARSLHDKRAIAMLQLQEQLSRFTLIGNERRKQITTAVENDITNVLKNAGNKRLSIVDAEIRARLAKARNLGRRMQAQVATQGGMTMGRGGSRGIQALFQVQQAVEDFQFAGFRGMANNLALLSFMMGGTGGTIALLGLMAVSVFNVSQALKSGGKEVEKYSDSIKKLRDAEDESDKLRRDRRDILDEQITDQDDADKAIADQTKRIRDLADAEAKLNKETRRMAAAKSVQEALASFPFLTFARRPGKGEFDTKLKALVGQDPTVPAVGEAQAAFERASRDFHQVFDRQVPLNMRGANAVLEEAILKANEAAEAYRELKNKVDATAEAMRRDVGIVKATQALEDAGPAVERMFERLGRLSDQFQNREVGATFNEMLRNRQKAAEAELKALREQVKVDPKQREAVNQGQVMANVLRIEKEILGVELQRAQVNDRIANIAGGAADALKDQIRNQESIIEKSKQTAIDLRNQAKESRFGFGGKKFGAEQSFIDKEVDFQKDAAIKSDKQFLQKKFNSEANQLIQAVRARFGFGKAANDFLQQALEAKGQAFSAAEQRRKEAIEKRAEDTRLRRQQELFGSRRGALLETTKGLGANINKALAEGTPASTERAIALIERLRNVFEELQSLDFEQAGFEPDPKKAKEFLDLTAVSQAQIEKTFIMQAEAEEQRAKLAQQNKAVLEGMLAVAENIQKTAEQVKFPIDQWQQALGVLNQMAEAVARINGGGNAGAVGGGKPNIGGIPVGGPATGPNTVGGVRGAPGSNPLAKPDARGRGVQPGGHLFGPGGLFPGGSKGPGDFGDAKAKEIKELEMAIERLNLPIQQTFNERFRNRLIKEREQLQSRLAAVKGLATGGRVTSAQPFLVGEKGPELFMPTTSGNVFTANDTRRLLNRSGAVLGSSVGGSNTTTNSTTNVGVMNINSRGSVDAEEVARELSRARKASLIRQG